MRLRRPASGRARQRRRTAPRRPACHVGDVPATSARRLDVEREQDLAVARRLEALVIGRAEPRAGPGDGRAAAGRPALYGRTPAKRDGSSVSPARARSRPPQRSGRASSGTRHDLRPDEELVDVVEVLAGGVAREQVADATRGSGPSRSTPRRSGVDVERGGRRARTGRASRRCAAPQLVSSAATRPRARTTTPERRLVIGAQPGQRQALAVPDLDRASGISSPQLDAVASSSWRR